MKSLIGVTCPGGTTPRMSEPVTSTVSGISSACASTGKSTIVSANVEASSVVSQPIECGENGRRKRIGRGLQGDANYLDGQTRQIIDARDDFSPRALTKSPNQPF